MKRVLLLIAGYYLVFQAAITALSILTSPEYAIFLIPIATLSGWGGYRLILLGRGNPKRLYVPDTQPLPIADRDTKPLDKNS